MKHQVHRNPDDPNSEQISYLGKMQMHFSSSTSLLDTSLASINISSTTATEAPEEIAAGTPVEIGTRGTIGSLILREIEYFSQRELSRQGSSKKPELRITDLGSSSGHSRHHSGSVMANQKKKKKGSWLRPSVCSLVEVADNNRYRNLKSDLKKQQA